MSDEEWPDDGDDNDGWDMDEEEKLEEALQDHKPNKLAKAGSINSTEILSFSLTDLITKEIPKQIENA